MLTVKLDKLTPCVSLKEASALLRAWVEREGLGASDTGRDVGIVRNGRTFVARVSYNGRVWDKKGKEILP